MHKAFVILPLTAGWVWSLGRSEKEYRRDAKDMESPFRTNQVPRSKSKTQVDAVNWALWR